MTSAAPAHRDLHPVMWAIWAVLGTALFNALTGDLTLLTIGGYNFQIPEFVLIFLLPALLLLAMRTTPVLSLTTTLIWTFAAIWGFGLLRGLADAPAAALTSLRSTAILPIFLLLATYLPKYEMPSDRILNAVKIAGALAGALVLLRTLFGPILFYSASIASQPDINDGGRAISAAGALLIAAAAIVAVYQAFAQAQLKRLRWRQLLTAMLLIAALLMSLQATAILAGLAGLLAVFCLAPGTYRTLRQLGLAAMVVSAMLILLAAPDLFSEQGLAGLLPADLAFQLSRRAANLNTRNFIWSGLLDSFQYWSTVDQLFGLPAGTRPQVLVPLWGGTYWEFSMHSMYFGLLPYAGIAGLAVFLALMVVLLFETWRKRDRATTISGTLGFAFAAMLLVYGYGYDLRNEQGLFLALAAVSAMQGRQARAAALAPAPTRA